jgi:hypothetical protein
MNGQETKGEEREDVGGEEDSSEPDSVVGAKKMSSNQNVLAQVASARASTFEHVFGCLSGNAAHFLFLVQFQFQPTLFF